MITVDEFANSSPVPVSVTFAAGGSNFAVAGFTASDVTVNGGTVSNFTGSGGGGHTYNFSITPTTFPSTVTITIPQGAASGGGGIYGNDITSKSFRVLLLRFLLSQVPSMDLRCGMMARIWMAMGLLTVITVLVMQ